LIVLDRLLIGGLRFVLGRIVDAVDAESDDEPRLKEELLEAQMRLEVGELTAAEFAEREAEILQALRRIRERQRQATPSGARIEGAELTLVSGHEDEPHRR
jgi:hypothetical protein